MGQVPAYVSLVFILITIATFGFIYFSVLKAEHSKKITIARTTALILIGWLGLTAFLSWNGFFLNFDAMPPRLLFTLGPSLIVIFYLMLKTKTRNFLMNMPIATLTYLHIIRVPVEIVLWWLFLSGLVPKLMTFEGINYDILSGVTAPFIAIFAVGTRNKRKAIAIVWNFIALGLLFNIVGHAILSAPTPFQKFAFDTPNVGVLYFPFVWLPAFIVPAVFFSHIVSLMKLFNEGVEVK